MPEPTDVIVIQPGASPDDRWTYRYAAPPTEEDGTVLLGFTGCCRRMTCTPAAMLDAKPKQYLSGKWPIITDCCDRPITLYGPPPVELPPYSGEHATCRKCGSKAVETKFTTKGADATGIYVIPRAGYPAEWLARHCAVCQATWDEATVESGAEEKHAAYGLLDPSRPGWEGTRPFVWLEANSRHEGVQELLRCRDAPLSEGMRIVRNTGDGNWEVLATARSDGSLEWILVRPEGGAGNG